MSARVLYGRVVAGCGLVAAMIAGPAALTPGTADAADAAGGPARVTSMVETWHMNETSGTAMLDAAGLHLGRLHHVTLGNRGANGTDYGFNGHSSYVAIPSADDLNAGSEDVHISFALKTSTVPARPDYDLFRKGQAPGPQYKVELQPNGQVSCHFKGDRAGVTVQAGPDLHDGRWHQVGCERLSSKVRLTVDGETWTRSRSVGYISNSYDVVIGAHPHGDFYHGELDELSFSIG